MARGWESKSVEAQIEEGKQQPLTGPAASREALRVKQRMETLRLSRSRVLQQLEQARHPAHREVLNKGLQAIEQELEAITPKEDSNPNPKT